MFRKKIAQYSLVILILIILLACTQTERPLAIPTIIYKNVVDNNTPVPAQPAGGTGGNVVPSIRQPDDPSIQTPTPDSPRELPKLRLQEEQYTVEKGDSLGKIASQYKVTVPMIINANRISNPDVLEVGQELVIPAPEPGEEGTSFKIIPDSELVYGPMARILSVPDFVGRYDSFLSKYEEVVEGQTMTGPEIVNFVAHDYSVNPRLLLAVLEYQSGWVTQANPAEDTRDFPMGVKDGWRSGLYAQLAWAADALNRGFYLWKVNGIGGWLLTDGTVVPIDPTINAGTAGVQQLFANLYDRSGWDEAVSKDGVFKTFSNFFGYPFDYAIEPLIPSGLKQPEMQLPFEPNVNWAFTGGPHGGWASGSAWAALDFAPGNEARGCVQSDYWVVAAADGTIVRADQGRVIQDLDEDGNEGTGWIILYMHIEARDRVKAGTYLKAGDPIGHPSCEGGYSTGTHTHLARRYNGVWISADQTQSDNGVPFVLDGWVSSGDGIEYDGYLQRDEDWIEAWEGVYPGNTVHR